MKKYLPAFILILPILFFAAPAFAADSISVSPGTATTTTEGSVVITANSDQGYWVPFLFTNSGAAYAGINASTSYPNGTSTWSAISFPTGLATGTYYVAGLENNGGCAGGGCTSNVYCTGSGNRAACMTAYGSQYFETTITISAPGGGGGGGSSTAPFYSTSTTASTSQAVFNEVVKLPLFIFQNYESALAGMAVLLILISVIFGMLKYFNIL